MIQIALAPCSPFSVTESLMRDSCALAARHGVRLHTHLAETQDEEAWCRARFGCRPVDYLERVGWLDDRVWLAHGIWFDEAEIGRLGRARVAVSHCPTSNMILASGCCPVGGLEAAGAPVGLGVDGSASNDSSNLIETVRHAFLLQRLMHGAEHVSHKDALRWATRGSAGCLGRADIGAIAPGLQADLALFRLDELRFSGAGDPLAALVLCGATPRRPGHGRRPLGGRGRRHPGLDLPALIHAHSRAAAEPAAALTIGTAHGRRRRRPSASFLAQPPRGRDRASWPSWCKVPVRQSARRLRRPCRSARPSCSKAWASRSSAIRCRTSWCAPTA